MGGDHTNADRERRPASLHTTGAPPDQADRQESGRRRIMAATRWACCLTIAAAGFALLYLAPRGHAAQASFRWGHQTWTHDEGDRFSAWLRSRGFPPARFKANHPDLAAVFGPKWPASPVARLQACASASCVPDVVRHVFGARAATALRVVRCETGGTFSPYATGDGYTSHGIWQIHLPAHPDVTLAEARSPWISTHIAYRWSAAGTNFSPTWTCATLLGIP